MGFLFGFFRQSDKVTDLTYAVSFIVGSVLVMVVSGHYSLGNIVLVGMIGIWGLRLAGYLFRRIQQMGHDHRFDDMRPSPVRLGGFWTLQTITIWIVLLPTSLFIAAAGTESLSALQYIGIVLWFFGFVMETVADAQKTSFKSSPGNKGRFVRTGLWTSLRHPNYTGEILVWIGLFLFTIPALSGIQFAAVVSPIWIAFLLIFVSGIPLLEKSWEKRYGGDPEWEAYKKRSDRLLPGIY